MTSTPESCDDPDCPACALKKFFEKAKAEDVPFDVMFHITMTELADAYEMNFEAFDENSRGILH